MPGGDGTGPRGLGPGTGWGYGPCGAGRRFGRGSGIGRGFRQRFPDEFYRESITKEEEIGILGVEARGLEAELKRIKERLKNLESKE